MLQEKIVKEEMIFIQPHIKLGLKKFNFGINGRFSASSQLMCDLLAERNKKDMFDPVVGQIMRIYGYFVMKKVSISQRWPVFEDKILQEEHELRVMQRTGSLMYRLAHKVSLH